jgi:hypothetical protein
LGQGLPPDPRPFSPRAYGYEYDCNALTGLGKLSDLGSFFFVAVLLVNTKRTSR